MCCLDFFLGAPVVLAAKQRIPNDSPWFRSTLHWQRCVVPHLVLKEGSEKLLCIRTCSGRGKSGKRFRHLLPPWVISMLLFLKLKDLGCMGLDWQSN